MKNKIQRSFSTLEQRIQWLLKHPVHLKDPDKHRIVECMKKDGLISEKTYWGDVRGIEVAIEQARARIKLTEVK